MTLISFKRITRLAEPKKGWFHILYTANGKPMEVWSQGTLREILKEIEWKHKREDAEGVRVEHEVSKA